VISVDCKNAFNSMSRNTILSEVLQRCPPLAPLAMVLLGSPTQARFTDPISREELDIEVTEGTTQGSPVGGIMFSLAFKRALDKVREAHPNILMPHYFDDV
jgi:hypothetical protein